MTNLLPRQNQKQSREHVGVETRGRKENKKRVVLYRSRESLGRRNPHIACEWVNTGQYIFMKGEYNSLGPNWGEKEMRRLIVRQTTRGPQLPKIRKGAEKAPGEVTTIRLSKNIAP